MGTRHRGAVLQHQKRQDRRAGQALKEVGKWGEGVPSALVVGWGLSPENVSTMKFKMARFAAFRVLYLIFQLLCYTQELVVFGLKTCTGTQQINQISSKILHV